MFGMNKANNESILKYNNFLANENRKLQQKVDELEKQLEISQKNEKASTKLLEKYKAEYEDLIDQSKKLVNKQRSADKELDKITESYKKELEKLINNNK